MKNNKKILVAFASRYGTTAEVAKIIAETLGKENVSVDLKHVSEINNIEDYSAVIIGAPIQYDKWVPESKKFVIQNKNFLSTIPVAYFFTCMTLSQKTESSVKAAKVYTDDLRNLVPEVKPIDVKGFAGAVNFSKIPFHIRYLLKLMLLIKGAKEGDFRDWNEIRNWARSLVF